MKRRGNTPYGAYTGSFSGWRMSYRREDNAPTKSLVTSKNVKPTSMKSKFYPMIKKLRGKSNQSIIVIKIVSSVRDWDTMHQSVQIVEL